jgi:hypothetical protein
MHTRNSQHKLPHFCLYLESKIYGIMFYLKFTCAVNFLFFLFPDNLQFQYQRYFCNNSFLWSSTHLTVYLILFENVWRKINEVWIEEINPKNFRNLRIIDVVGSNPYEKNKWSILAFFVFAVIQVFKSKWILQEQLKSLEKEMKLLSRES